DSEERRREERRYVVRGLVLGDLVPDGECHVSENDDEEPDRRPTPSLDRQRDAREREREAEDRRLLAIRHEEASRVPQDRRERGLDVHLVVARGDVNPETVAVRRVPPVESRPARGAERQARLRREPGQEREEEQAGAANAPGARPASPTEQR